MTYPLYIDRETNELYETLSAEVREVLLKLEQVSTFPAGAQLIAQNVAPEHVIILNQGSVEISVPAQGKTISMALAGNGKVFGLRSVVSGELPEINVICLEECTVTLLPRAGFLRTLKQYPQVYFAVAKVLSADLKLAQDLLREMPRAVNGASRRMKVTQITAANCRTR